MPIVVCLWHGALSEDDRGVWQDDSHRDLAAQLEAQANDKRKSAAVRSRSRDQAKRARQVDAAIRTAWENSEPLRVVLNEGDRRPRSSLGKSASKVKFRSLDPVPWRVSSYDTATGRFRLTRGALSEAIADAKSPRNPRWLRDELILALNLYLANRRSPPGKDSAEVAELSALLNRLGKALGVVEGTTYRNPNGVYMKMMNFRRLDPEFVAEGRTGLVRGNKDEAVVWKEYAHRPDELAKVAAAIRAGVEAHEEAGDLTGPEEPGIEEAPEGRVLTRIHRARERSRKLVEAKKAEALKRHGRLQCEACSFVFSERYGSAGDGIIDCHHTRPVHTLAEDHTTRLSDLALLCANCHRVVHSRRRWLTLEELRAAIKR